MYYRNRYYDTDLGRFISRDPMGYAAGDMNLYGYVGGNPMSFSDPLGLEKLYGPEPKRWYNDSGWDWLNPFAYTTAVGEYFGTSAGEAYGNYVYSQGDQERIYKHVERMSKDQAIFNEGYYGSRNPLHCKAQDADNMKGCATAIAETGVQLQAASCGMAGPSSGARPASFSRPNPCPQANELGKANYAQKTFGETFSQTGKFAGQTVDDVARALRTGRLSPADVPIEYIVRDGNTLILNTRSSQALQRAGIHRSRWIAIDVSGDAAAQARLTGQLQRNKLTNQGIPTVRPCRSN